MVLFDIPRPRIGHLRLNDPERLNAMGTSMAADFSTALEAARTAQVRVLVLSGSGRAFSSGGDFALLEERPRHSMSENRAFMLDYYQTFLAVRDLNVPLVAALQGHAVGAGACLACACDLRVAGPQARLGFSFTRLGLHPGLGITWSLGHLVGPGRASELLLTGRHVDAQEAFQMGLVNVLADDPLAKALELAESIAANGPLATELLLGTLRAGLPTLAQALQAEATAQAVNYGTPEFEAGLAAVRERRPPRFT